MLPQVSYWLYDPTYWKLYVETLSRKKPRERSPQLNPPQAERD